VPAFMRILKQPMLVIQTIKKSTTRDVKLSIDTLKIKIKVDAIVMDLRANGGGSLLEANDLTGLFIDGDLLFRWEGLKGNVEVSSNEHPAEDCCLGRSFGVMVDRLSASASEISFAGAIQVTEEELLSRHKLTVGIQSSNMA